MMRKRKGKGKGIIEIPSVTGMFHLLKRCDEIQGMSTQCHLKCRACDSGSDLRRQTVR